MFFFLQLCNISCYIFFLVTSGFLTIKCIVLVKYQNRLDGHNEMFVVSSLQIDRWLIFMFALKNKVFIIVSSSKKFKSSE